MKKAYIYINYANIVVLQTYLDVIKKSLENVGYDCKYVKTLKDVDRKSLIVHSMGIDAFKFYLKGYNNFILWQQGETADESYLRNRSKLRHFLLNRIDVFAMKKARYIFYVSEYMRTHYQKLGHTSFVSKSYIMPCFNESLGLDVFKRKNYNNKVFCYVGSLDLWQCFRETAELYKKIEDKIQNTKFKVLTFNVSEGERIIKEMGIRNYEIKSVPKDQVKNELLEATYGFIIRRDNIVNRVATPTKFSSYMSAGVIPIFSSCLDDFNNLSTKMKYVLSLNQDYKIENILRFTEQPINISELEREYNEIFNSYYSADIHCRNITDRFLADKL